MTLAGRRDRRADTTNSAQAVVPLKVVPAPVQPRVTARNWLDGPDRVRDITERVTPE